MKTPEFLNIAYFSKEIDNLDSNGLKMLDFIFDLIERIEPYQKSILFCWTSVLPCENTLNEVFATTNQNPALLLPINMQNKRKR